MNEEEYEIIFVPNEGRAVLNKKTKRIYYSEFQIIEEKNEELNKYKQVLDKIKEYCNNRLEYYNEMRRDYNREFDGYAENDIENILELLEEIE